MTNQHEKRSWFIKDTGADFDEFKKSGSTAVSYFSLDCGKSATVVVLDDPLFTAYQHTFPIPQSSPPRYQTVTCKGRGCLLCGHTDQQMKSKSLTQFLTVLELTDEANLYSGTKKFLGARGSGLEILRRRRDSLGGLLKSKRLRVHRGKDKKSPRAGSDFEVIDTVDLNKLPEVYEPFDYEKLCAPMSDEEVNALLTKSNRPVRLPSEAVEPDYSK